MGEGTRDLVFTTSPIHNVDVMWERPSIARYMGRLAGIGRLIVYNPRGSGVSSPVPPGTSLQEWMDDARGVMDAAGVERAAIIGDTEGGPTAMMFAATYPERTSALVLINTFARFLRDADYPAGIPAESVPNLVGSFEAIFGTGGMTERPGTERRGGRGLSRMVRALPASLDAGSGRRRNRISRVATRP